jgi:hypothetical protein
MRTLRIVRREKVWESEQWEKLQEDILLNMEDEMVDNEEREL